MTAALRLVRHYLLRHYLLRRPHVPRHAKPEPVSDDLIPFADYRHPYDSPKGNAA